MNHHQVDSVVLVLRNTLAPHVADYLENVVASERKKKAQQRTLVAILNIHQMQNVHGRFLRRVDLRSSSVFQSLTLNQRQVKDVMMTSQFMIMQKVDHRQGFPESNRLETYGQRVTLKIRPNLEHFADQKFHQIKGQCQIPLK